MRTIRLPDLLIEVDNDLRFTDHFVPPAQRGGRDAEDVCTLLAIVLAHGGNIGQAKEISRVVRWCQPEEEKIDVALLEHVSPIEWDNVILYGQYVLDRAQVR
jgi:hypothetical protein